MKNRKRLLFDYEIVGEYFDRVPQANGTVTMVKRYVKRWFCVPLRAYRVRKGR